MNNIELDRQLTVLADIANNYRRKERNCIEEYGINSIQSLGSIEENIIKYTTNLVEQTCNCKDWNIKRKNYTYNDPRRFCKHLVFLLNNDKLESALSFFKEDFEYYQNNKKGYKLNFEDIFTIPNANYKIQVNYERDWMNLFDKNGLRYGILLDEYNQINWAKKLPKPDDYKIVESFLIDLLVGKINELTKNEKNEIQDKINTPITEYFQKYRNKDYIVYGVNWAEDEDGEELHWSYIVINEDVIYLSLNNNNLYIIRNEDDNNKISNNQDDKGNDEVKTKLKQLIGEEESNNLKIDSMDLEQVEILYNWGIKMFTMGQNIVSDINEIKFEGKLISLDDGTFWEVDEFEAYTSEMWSDGEKVVVLDDEMYKLDDLEKVNVEQVFF